MDCSFEETDLFQILNYIYGPLIYSDEITPQFLSVCIYGDEVWLMEKIFYDMPLNQNVESVGTLGGKVVKEIGCWMPKGMPAIEPDWDTDFSKGKKLSRLGYLIENIYDEEDWELLKYLSSIETNGSYSDKASTYRATPRFSDETPDNQVFRRTQEFFLKYLPSPILKNMDFFNAQFAHYPEATEIDAHGDTDMSCLTNMVTQHSTDPNSHKETHIGVYDWYPKIMREIEDGTLGEEDVGRDSVTEPHAKIQCKDRQVIIFNFFNPRYYHYVPPTKGNQRVNLFFGSYRCIMRDRIIDW